MKLCETRSGYYRINLCKNGKLKLFLVSRLVAIAFIPNPHNYPEVDHIDRNPLNNNVNNLRWASRKINNDNRCDLQQAQSHRATPIIATNIKTKEVKYYKFQRDAIREFGHGVHGVLKGVPKKDGKGYLYIPKTCKGYKFEYA